MKLLKIKLLLIENHILLVTLKVFIKIANELQALTSNNLETIDKNLNDIEKEN